jgi:TonB family protein
LKALGLVRLFLGVESATARGLSVLERDQTVEESVRALETCSALDISAQYTLMTFHPDTTLDTLRADVAFMRRFSGNPLNFCRAEIYAGTPLEKRMIECGRARGDYRARAYDLIDPVADLAWNASVKLFHSRCWSSGSLMQNAIGLDHAAAVLKRFYKGPQREALGRRVGSWVRSVNLDTINLLDEVIELSASAGGRMDAGFQSAIVAIAERESRTRREFLSEAAKLRVDLQALRLPNRARQINPAALWPRLVKPAAAALFAIGIPATVFDQPAIAQQSQTAPPRSTAGQDKAMCSLVGRIIDPSGAVVPGTKITIINIDTGVIHTLTTDEGGQYVANDLVAGRYTVKADSLGFKTAIRTGIVLKEGVCERIDVGLTLEVGCCEYVAVTLDTPRAETNPYERKKPFTYVVGDGNDHRTFQGIAALVYGDRNAWIQIFEANRSVIAKPGLIPYGTAIWIPPRKRVVPKLISKVMPAYPPAAAKAHVWGDVVLDVTLQEDGTVEETSVIDGDPLLVEAATSAVKQWRYRPLLDHGYPVDHFVVAVSFGKGGKVR